MSSTAITPNQHEIIAARSTISGKTEYLTSTNGFLNTNASVSISGTTLPIMGATTGIGVAILDSSGNQISSFGGGTQYTDGGVPPAHPIGGTIEWSDGSNWQTVSTAKPLPVTFSPSGTQNIQGTLTNNNAAPSTNNVGVLSALSNASAPSQTEGDMNLLSTNLSGRLRSTIDQISGVAISVGNGAAGTGVQRVTIASDNTAFPVNATLSAETTKVIGTVNQGTSPWVVSGTINATIVSPLGQTTASASLPVVLASDTINKEVSFGPTNSTGAMATTDVGQYKWVSVQLTAGTSINVSFQTSNDNSTWVANNLFSPGSISSLGTVTSLGIYSGQVLGRYFRVLVNSTPSGLAGTLEFSMHPGAYITPSVNTVYLNSTAISTDNGTSGSGVQRVTLASNSTGNIATIGTSVTPGTAAANLGKAEDAAHTGGDTGVFVLGVRTDTQASSSGTTGDYTALATDSVGAQYVTPSASTGAIGTTIYNNTALSNTKQAVNASAGNLYGYHIYNSNSVVIYVQLFNVASASVTVGTTAPTAVLAIPPLGWADAPPGLPISFATALTIAATTTATGSTAPSTALLCNMWYK